MDAARIQELERSFGAALEVVQAAKAPAVLLCRHSIRGPIPVDPARRDVPLLPEGVALCEGLGRRWGWPFASASTSPMRRCRDSLSAFARGAGVAIEAEATTLLGAPGAWIDDVDKAWKSYVESRKYELVARQHRDPGGVPGYHSLDEGAARLLAALQSRADADGPHLACSHDILMSCLLSWAFQREWPRPSWPDFFEGVALEFVSADRLRLTYRGEAAERSFAQAS